MKYLVCDFESRDPYIKRGVGAGWVYMMNTPNHDFKVLGCAVKGSDNLFYTPLVVNPAIRTGYYIKNTGDYWPQFFKDELKTLVEQVDVLVAHNAQYDFGILLAMGISLKDKLLFDTKIMSVLHYNALKSHSLDELGKQYFKEKKEKKQLADAVWDNDLYPWNKREIKEKEKFEKGYILESQKDKPDWPNYRRTRPLEAKLQKFAIENMDLLQEKCPEIVASYAIQDVVLTEKQFNFFYEKHKDIDWTFYSDLIKCCLKMRMQGVNIDLQAARNAHEELRPQIAQSLTKCYELAGKEFNIRSPKEVPIILKARGLELPKTAKGSDSVTTEVLESLDDELAKELVTARKLIKIDRDFIEHIQEIQQWTLGISRQEVDQTLVGKVYPEMNIMGATATGRFSCSSPNLQQIPARDPILGPLCRNLFIPEQGELWYSLDFSSQENRITLDAAIQEECEGVSALHKQFYNDPNIDMHQIIANMIGIDRKQAKTIGLGLMYGMGLKKLSKALTLDEESAKLILSKYHNKMPFLKELIKIEQDKMKQKGFVTTLLGRKIYDEPSVFFEGKELTFEYKALNKRIQGSAADQTMAAMVLCYREGIDINIVVHDEINLSARNEYVAARVQNIMETAIPLTIPMVAGLESGKSWGDSKFGNKEVKVK